MGERMAFELEQGSVVGRVLPVAEGGLDDFGPANLSPC